MFCSIPQFVSRNDHFCIHPRGPILFSQRLKRLFIALGAGLLCFSAYSQKPGNRVLSFDFSYAPVFPGGEWKKSYGFSNQVGAAIHLKTEQHFLFKAEGLFYFGNRLKNGEFLQGVSINTLEIINRYGQVLLPRLYQRGLSFGVEFSKKIIHHPKVPNNGWVAGFGMGYLQHKTRIEYPGEQAPVLTASYKKGYDRLHAGPYARLSFGYHYMEPIRKMLNGMLVLEYGIASTQNVRRFNYDTGMFDSQKKIDTWLSLKAIWMIPRFLTSANQDGDVIFR